MERPGKDSCRRYRPRRYNYRCCPWWLYSWHQWRICIYAIVPGWPQTNPRCKIIDWSERQIPRIENGRFAHKRNRITSRNSVWHNRSGAERSDEEHFPGRSPGRYSEKHHRLRCIRWFGRHRWSVARNRLVLEARKSPTRIGSRWWKDSGQSYSVRPRITSYFIGHETTGRRPMGNSIPCVQCWRHSIGQSIIFDRLRCIHWSGQQYRRSGSHVWTVLDKQEHPPQQSSAKRYGCKRCCFGHRPG